MPKEQLPCDFCYSSCDDGQLVYVDTFSVQIGTKNNIPVYYLSHGDWYACKTCYRLANEKQWSKLVRRVVAVAAEMQKGCPMPPNALAEMLSIVYGALEHNL
ncbi:MAG: hypothetical protein ACWGQW_26365, partial [bacterium]